MAEILNEAETRAKYAARAEEINWEGNEYIRKHKNDSYVLLLEKAEEFEAECKKNHSYFRQQPDVKQILEQAKREYSIETGTRYSPHNKTPNRFINYNNQHNNTED